MSWFTDSLKNALGITAAQKALQWVGQNSPQIANAAQSVQPVVNQVVNKAQNLYPEIQLPRMEAPSFLPSTVRWFANTVNPVNVASGIGQGLLNAPRNYIGGTVKTGLNLGNMLNDQPVPVTKLVGDAAQVGSAIMDASVLNFGKNIVKEGINQVAKPVAKQTISGLLKNAGKLSLQGAGYGGAFGALQGAQAPNDGDINTLIKNMLQQGGEGALGGAVAAPVLHYGTKLGGKIVKDFKSLSKEERQAGYFDPKAKVELPGQKNNLDLPQTPEAVLERLKKTLEKKKEYAPEKVGVPYEPTGNVKLNLKQTQLADTLSKEWSLQSPKTYDKTKSMPYIEGIIKSLGVDKIEALRRETTRYSKPKGITKFHELVQAELQSNEAFAQNAGKKSKKVTEMLKPQEVVTKPIIEAPIQAKPWEDAGYVLPEGRTPDSRVEIKTPDTFSPSAYPKVQPKTVNGMLKKSEYAPLSQPKEDYKTRKANTQVEVDRSYKALQEGIGDKLISDNLNRKGMTKAKATKEVEFMTKIPQEKAWNVIDAVQDKKIYDSSTPEVKIYADKIKEFYNKNLTYFRERGIKLNEVERYMPGYWKENPTGRGQKTLNPISSRSKEKFYRSYIEGKAAGKEPLYDHPATIAERALTDNYNAVINNETLRMAKESGLVVPSYVGEAHPDKFSPIDIPGFGSSEYKVGDKNYIGKWYGPKEFVAKLNKALGSGDQAQWKKNIGKVADASKTAQDFVLSGGIPKTAANFFTFTRVAFKDLPANLLNPKRMVKIAQDFATSFNERKTLEKFSEKSDTIKEINISGTPFNSTYSAAKLIKPNLMGKLFGKSIGDTWSKYMNEATFGRFIPLTQISFFEDVRDGLIKKGYERGEAIQIAGKALRNWEGMATITEQALQGKTRRNALTIAFMAPKYREALLNFMGNNVKSVINFKDPAYQANRRWIMGALAMTAMGEAINYGLNGHFTNENEPGTETKILIPIGKLTGDPNNKTVIAVPTMWGSSLFAIPRSATKSIKELIKGDVSGAVRQGIFNNASVLARPFVDLATNTNSFGSKIYNETDTSSDKFKKIWNYVMPITNEGKNNSRGILAHPFQNIVGLADENATDHQKAQSISQAMELPIRVYTTDQLSKKWYFKYLDEYTQGLTGQEKAIWDKLKTNTNPGEYDRRRTMSNAQDRLANPKLLEAETKIAKAVSEKTGNPLDPFYLLSPEQQKTVLLTQTLYPGDPQKTTIINANSDWIKPYYANKNEYTKTMQDLGIFEKNNDYETSKTSPEMQNKLDFYGTLPQGTGDRTKFLKQNPDVLAYFKENEIKTNIEREKLGLPPKASFGSSSGSGSNYVKNAIKWQSQTNVSKIKSAASKIKSARGKVKVKSIKSVLKGVKAIKKRKVLSAPARRKAIFPK